MKVPAFQGGKPDNDYGNGFYTTGVFLFCLNTCAGFVEQAKGLDINEVAEYVRDVKQDKRMNENNHIFFKEIVDF